MFGADRSRLFFLLYLARDTFLGEEGRILANQIRVMLKRDKLAAIVMVHEQDDALCLAVACNDLIPQRTTRAV